MNRTQAENLLHKHGYSLDTVSQRQAAKAWGVTRDSARHRLATFRNSTPDTVPPKMVKAETIETTENELKYEIPNTRIHTLEQLVEQFEIDLDKWTCTRFIANKWEVGAKDSADNLVIKPLYQVKAFFEKKKFDTLEFVKLEMERLKDEAKAAIKPFNINKVYPHNRKATDALEVSIYDLHLGKLAWKAETGGASYDLKIARKTGESAFNTLLARSQNEDIGKIMLVVGQDFINQDNIAGTTTRGTAVIGDGRYHKLFQAGFDLFRQQIETALQIAPVEVVTCVGNHDTHVSFGIAHSLECLFHGNKHVSFDNSPSMRKYWQHGNSMVMLTHGDKEKRVDLPMIMATERPQMFGQCDYHEGHVGHTHQTKLDEKFGVRIRVIPSLTPPDAWHSESGYINNIRAAQSFLWSKFDGLKTIQEYNIKRLEE